MAEGVVISVSNNPKEYYRQRYEKNGAKISAQKSIRYYRRKKEKGLDWIPSPTSKFYLWCQLNGYDAKSLVEGTQQLQL